MRLRYILGVNFMYKAIRVWKRAAPALAAGFLFSLASAAQEVPKQLQPPAGERLLSEVHAMGYQIYSCITADGGGFAWTLQAPDAKLFDKSGKLFGGHFAGPSWEANDGSLVMGKAVASAPSPDANSIPWLLVTVIRRSGEGVLAHVTSVQRLNTKGGKAPASGCDATHAGEVHREPYSADYAFFAPK